jgi:mandelate racemase
MTPLTITAIRTRSLIAPLIRPVTTASGTIPAAPLVVIDLETKEGVVGRSYLFTYTPLSMRPLAQLIDNISETLIGKSVEPVARMAQMEHTFRLLGRQGLVAMAIAGLDMALWDASAKAHDMSVARMLGGTHDPIPCYDSHGIIDPAHGMAAIEGSLAQGFRAIKVKVGGALLQTDVDTLKSVREVIGPDVRLMIDYNQSLTVPEAIRRITRLEDEGIDLDWVEEPVGAEDFVGHRAVRANVRTSIQTGENWWMPDDAARAIQADISDQVMIDIMKIGGVTGWQRAAPLAQAASLPISSHIFVEASAHVLSVTPNTYLLEYLDIAGAIQIDPPQVIDGMLAPQGPGLGMTWDEAAIKRYQG